jgi:Helix-turn-helix domain
MRTHRKLTSHERDKIAYWYAVGERIREIARRLGGSHSSISDEIKRNKIGGRYHSIGAHQASEARKHNSHKKYVLKTRPTLQSYVLESCDLAGRPSRSREDCGKRSTKGDDHLRSTSTMSPFTSTSMTSRRVSGDCGRSSRGAIGNDGAGWAEKAGR